MVDAIGTPADSAGKQDILTYAQAVGLSVGYASETIVNNIDFKLPKGQALALIGTNGSGKSTLLKTIVGLLAPRKGEISVFGGRPREHARRIAYLGQFHNAGFILPLRAVDVVSMGRFPLHGLVGNMDETDFEIGLAAMRAMGIEKQANTPLRSLSGGQQQRVYLAQVLAHRADLLVMDEPTSGLDAGGRDLYLRAMHDEMCRGASIIVATHDIQEEATLCQQVMLLARRVVAFGPPQQVLTAETLLETFGIVIGKDQKRPAVLECAHGHDDHDTEHPPETKPKRRFWPR